MKLILIVSVIFALAPLQNLSAKSFENGKIECFISTKSDYEAEKYVLEEEIVRFISEAEFTLDIAVQELRWGKIAQGVNPIKQAILDKARAGLEIRMIVEKGYLEPDSDNLKTFKEFEKEPNIEIKKDSNPDIFHNKFIVRDLDNPKAALLTGSTNFTDTGVRRNYNHIIVIHFKNHGQANYDILKKYQYEFDEAFSGKFGDLNKIREPIKSYRIGHTTINVLFSPDDDPDDKLLELICKAEESLDVMMFTFGSNTPLLSGVINRFYAVKYVNKRPTSERKLSVRVAMESEQAKWWSVYDTFKTLGIPLKLERNASKLHHKVAIIDEKKVVMGSYNWTLAANVDNDENILVVRNPQIAEFFREAFDELWNEVLMEE